MSVFDGVRKRAYASIAKKGGTIVFYAGTAPTWNNATDLPSGGAPANVTGKAVQLPGDFERFATLATLLGGIGSGLVLNDPILLLLAAQGLTITPVPGMRFNFGGADYTIRSVEALRPDGNGAITYDVIGSR